ncbi:MAG: hypothetical protein RMM51_00655 [Verrucomicrobiae bacterium]|nr:hypothetical protein [Verrucomicrobiae bacterium]
MTSPNNNVPTPPTPPPEPERPTYEGSRLPWWIIAWFVAFFIFGIVYHLRYALPDFQLWLTDAVGQMWR